MIATLESSDQHDPCPSTGPALHELHRLRDGAQIVVRHIRPADAAELIDGFGHLSPETRRLRFFGGLRRLTPQLTEYLTNVDQIDHVALVAATEEGHGLGVARFIRDRDDRTSAEAAITVAEGEHGRGIGTVLLRALARAAHERGVRALHGEILWENTAMRRLLARAGARVRFPREQPSDGRLSFEVDV